MPILSGLLGLCVWNEHGNDGGNEPDACLSGLWQARG